jgi:hypothetical protein
MALINQTPSDWANLVDPINSLGVKQESLLQEVDSLKSYLKFLHDEFDERLKFLELKEVRRDNLVKAREIKSKK